MENEVEIWKKKFIDLTKDFNLITEDMGPETTVVDTELITEAKTYGGVTIITADWKDNEDLIKGFKKSIRKLGGFVYNHPDFEGTDTFGFIVSDKQLSKKEVGDFSED